MTFFLFNIGECYASEDSNVAYIRSLTKLVLVGGISSWKGESVLKTNGVNQCMFPVFGGIETRDKEKTSCFSHDDVHVVFSRILVRMVGSALYLFNSFFFTDSREIAVEIFGGVIVENCFG